MRKWSVWRVEARSYPCRAWVHNRSSSRLIKLLSGWSWRHVTWCQPLLRVKETRAARQQAASPSHKQTCFWRNRHDKRKMDKKTEIMKQKRPIWRLCRNKPVMAQPFSVTATKSTFKKPFAAIILIKSKLKSTYFPPRLWQRRRVCFLETGEKYKIIKSAGEATQSKISASRQMSKRRIKISRKRGWWMTEFPAQKDNSWLGKSSNVQLLNYSERGMMGKMEQSPSKWLRRERGQLEVRCRALSFLRWRLQGPNQ